MAITAAVFDTFVSTVDNTDSFSTANTKTVTANTAYVVGVIRTNSAALSVVPTLSGWGITWTQVQRVTLAGGGRDLTIFEGNTSSPTAGTLTCSYVGDAITGDAVIAIEVGGDIAATDPVRDATIGTATGASTSRTVALAGDYAQTTHAAIAFFHALLGTAVDVTAEAEWTELSDISFSAPNTHSQCQFRADAGSAADTNCTATWDGTSVQNGAVILELQAVGASSSFRHTGRRRQRLLMALFV